MKTYTQVKEAFQHVFEEDIYSLDINIQHEDYLRVTQELIQLFYQHKANNYTSLPIKTRRLIAAYVLKR